MTSHELDDMQNRPPNIAVKDGTGKASKCKCLQTKACKIALAVFIVLAAIATIVIVALLVTGYYDERRYVFHVRNVSIDHSDIHLTIDGNTTGPAIHVKTGQWLSVNVENEIEVLKDKNASLGLSIHWHGLDMRGNNFFDGVVGITQCPIVETKSFEYRWKIDEQPGTYWYHTHDRKPFNRMSDDSKHPHQTNFIHGPLIIHPSDSKFSEPSLDPPRYEYRWDNQIILFYSNQVLNGETEKNHNEKQTIHVEKGQEYTFRIINGAGTNPHSYYFSIGTPPIPLTVIATDAYPVEPYTTNMINIAIAERYDVNVTIDFTENVWIRAISTEKESESVYAWLKVGQNEKPPPESDKNVSNSITKSTDILNCYNDEFGGSCFPVTDLVPTVERNHIPSVAYHTYDIKFTEKSWKWVFEVSLDSGEFKENNIPLRSILEKMSKSDQEEVRSKTNILSLPAEKSVTIIIRSTTSFTFHPMHMHGHHFEVLEIANKAKNPDCKLLDKVEDYFGQTIEELMNRKTTGVLKDTVILPACGAVAIRINSDNPGVWFFHCHIDKHMYEGLAVAIDENNFMFSDPPFPSGYPSCSKLY